MGNDQSTDAFADEALADYFSRKAHLSIRSSRCKTDRLDREIRAYSGRLLLRGHLRPGRALPRQPARGLRLGKFKAAIRAYTKDNRDDIANNARLLEAFRAEMGDGVLQRYRSRFPSLY